MSQPIAKEGDNVVGVDTHIVMVSSPGGPVPTPMAMPFQGPLSANLSTTVFIDNKAAATVGSEADNQPPHIPIGGSFQKPPGNRARVSAGSTCVFADNRALARCNDPATCCNDPADKDTGHVIAAGKTFAG